MHPIGIHYSSNWNVIEFTVEYYPLIGMNLTFESITPIRMKTAKADELLKKNEFYV